MVKHTHPKTITGSNIIASGERKTRAHLSTAFNPFSPTSLKPLKSIAAIGVLVFVAACSQSTQQSDPVGALSYATTKATIKITDTAVGHANLYLAGNGTTRELYRQRDCALGKYAQKNGVSHILVPTKTNVSFVSIDGVKQNTIDHPFEYFVTGQTMPSGAHSRDRLLANCSG